MNGQMTRYRKSLEQMSDPIMPGQIDQKVDLKGIMQYAKKKDVKVIQLTDKEKKQFLKNSKKIN